MDENCDDFNQSVDEDKGDEEETEENFLETVDISTTNNANVMDFLETDIQGQGISWLKAAFLIINAALGGGLLNFSMAFKESGGIASGNIIHLVFVSFAFGSLIILGKCASERQCSTYQEVIKEFCGLRWSLLVSTLISIYCFITCITFIIIIGDQFDRVFASYVGSDFCHFWYMNRKFTMTITSILLIGPCCFKRIDGFQFMSYVGVASIWYLTCIIAEELINSTYEKGEVNVWDVNPIKMFLVVPTVCFGYQCHVSSIPIYSCLKKKNHTTFSKACSFAIFVCILVYTISANSGYLTFGSRINADILLSYDAKRPEVLVAILLLALKSWTTYPILLFCVREAVNDLYLNSFAQWFPAFQSTENFRRKIIACSLCIGSIIFAVFIPNIDVAVKLLGSLAAFFIFVFPGLCLMMMTLDSPNIETESLKMIGYIVLSLLYIGIGAFTFGLSLTLGIEEITRATESVPLCS